MFNLLPPTRLTATGLRPSGRLFQGRKLRTLQRSEIKAVRVSCGGQCGRKSFVGVESCLWIHAHAMSVCMEHRTFGEISAMPLNVQEGNLRLHNIFSHQGAQVMSCGQLFG